MCRKLQTKPKLNITSNLIIILVKELEQSNVNSTQVRLTITNIQSLKNKDLLLYDHINTFNTDITVIMETCQKSKENDTAWLNPSLLRFNNHRLYTSKRKTDLVVVWHFPLKRQLWYRRRMKVGYYPLSIQSGAWISTSDNTLRYCISTDHLT